jgi:hypothetical protein
MIVKAIAQMSSGSPERAPYVMANLQFYLAQGFKLEHGTTGGMAGNTDQPERPAGGNKPKMTSATKNQNPEQIARDEIDKRLSEAGWIVQDKKAIDFNAGQGIAIREYQTDVRPADYMLFVDKKAVGVIQAKPDDVWLLAALADHRQCVARRAATRVDRS